MWSQLHSPSIEFLFGGGTEPVLVKPEVLPSPDLELERVVKVSKDPFVNHICNTHHEIVVQPPNILCQALPLHSRSRKRFFQESPVPVSNQCILSSRTERKALHLSTPPKRKEMVPP